MKTYNGKILNVDLSSGRIESEPFGPDFARKYMGGNGFAAKILYDSVKAGTDPLSESNIIVLATGPLGNTGVWGAERGHAGALSPLTGFFGDSNFGGDFASILKRTGYDAIAIRGKAGSPVYLSISGETAEIRDARHLWGKGVEETFSTLREQEGPGSESAAIGPAGENGVLFANIMCSGKRVSAAGRCGLGAVLGSKNCKGISARGTRPLAVSDRSGVIAVLNEQYPFLHDNAKFHRAMGTPFFVNLLNNMGKLPTRNARFETFDRAGEISGEVIRDRYRVKNISCMRCPIACGKQVKITGGEYEGTEAKMAEYETLYAFGSMLENGDLISIFNANRVCDDMGIDTISMGVTLAYVAELYEKGIMAGNEFPERVEFGSRNDLPGLIRKTARREGIGEILSLGSERISERRGKDAKKYLYSAKGLELAGHSVRSIANMGLGYATSNRGGSHHDARPRYFDPQLSPDPDYIISNCIKGQHYSALGDSLVMCRFVMERGFGAELNDPLRRVLSAATGIDFTLEELNTIGERIYNLERMVGVRLGLSRARDTLPPRATDEPVPAGPSAGMRVDPGMLESMLAGYYRERGWDPSGVPSPEKLRELGI